jgi:adenylylsulfate reductase subunit A
MINGESYKVVVAEAAKKALETNRAATGIAQNHFERVFIVKAVMDKNGKNVGAAVGFSVREILSILSRQRQCSVQQPER